MKRFSVKFAAALVTSGALGLTAASAQPATTPADPTPPPTATPPAEPAASTASAPAAADPATTRTIRVGDEEIRSFAMALIELDPLQRQYGQRIQQASPEQRPVIEQEANERMTAIVEAQGIDAPTFNAISASAQEDPALQARIQQEVTRVQASRAQ